MFHIIPENFFVPLASPNKIVYWECICKLFCIMEHQLSFGVQRDVLVEKLQYYFESANSAELVGEDVESDSSRNKANWMLRRLEFYGWIEIETDKSYVQRVNFNEYAVKVLKTLLEIQDDKQVEYQGYIYTIYSIVRSNTEHPGIMLMQILENTDLLITGLKNLNSNIKHYIDELTRHKTVAEIMDVLFNDKNFVNKAAEELAEIKEESLEEAEELVYQYIHMIAAVFQSMDDILEEIKRKNTQYQKAAINRAKFLLTGSEDIRGQLKEILVGIGEEMNRESMDIGGIYRIDFLEELVRMYSVSVIDEKSLYSPIEGKKEFKPGESVKEFIDLEKLSETEVLLKGIHAVECNTEQCYVREFSIKTFHDTKFFEKNSSKIAKVMRRFCEEFVDKDADEIFAEYGIYYTPNYVYFKGDVKLDISGESLQIGTLKQGIGISGDDIEKIQFADVMGVEQVLTVENLTTFAEDAVASRK